MRARGGNARFLLAALASLACLLAGGAGATTADTSFTWTGGGPDQNWSDAVDWGGSAPAAAGGTVDLMFPAVACSPVCASTTDDLAGLSVGTLTVANLVDPDHYDLDTTAYSIAGATPLTLDGGIDVVDSDGAYGEQGATYTILDPSITLGADNSWSVDGWARLQLRGAVSGMHALTISAGNGSVVQLFDSIETGPVTVTGSGASGVKLTPDPFGTAGDVNGTDGEPVELTDASFDGVGTVGPLTMQGGELQIGDEYPSEQYLKVNGAVTLSAQTLVSFPELSPTSGYLDVTGAANLADAQLRVNGICLPPGRAVTLVAAAGGVSGTFTDSSGAAITDGQLVPLAGSDECGTAAFAQVSYSADTVTVTGVAQGGGSGLTGPTAPTGPRGPTTTTTATTTSEPTASTSATTTSTATTSTTTTTQAPALRLTSSSSGVSTSRVVPTSLTVVRSQTQGASAVRLSLRCTGPRGARCVARATLTSVETLAGSGVKAVTAARRRRVGVGSATATLAAGTSTSLRVNLNLVGRRLLDRFGTLPVRLSVTLDTAGRSALVATHRLALHRAPHSG